MKTRAFPFLKHSRRKGVTGITFGEHFRVNDKEGGGRALHLARAASALVFRCARSAAGGRQADRSVSNIGMAIA
jgi:hypothetical protein